MLLRCSPPTCYGMAPSGKHLPSTFKEQFSGQFCTGGVWAPLCPKRSFTCASFPPSRPQQARAAEGTGDSPPPSLHIPFFFFHPGRKGVEKMPQATPPRIFCAKRKRRLETRRPTFQTHLAGMSAPFGSARRRTRPGKPEPDSDPLAAASSALADVAPYAPRPSPPAEPAPGRPPAPPGAALEGRAGA